jgi:hypothetical protein
METTFCRLCLKLLPPTTLTYWLSFYPYQKDERAMNGYLIKRWCFSPSDINSLYNSTKIFSLLLVFYYPFLLSLSLSFTSKGTVPPNPDSEMEAVGTCEISVTNIRVKVYTALQPARSQLTFYPPPWEPEISNKLAEDPGVLRWKPSEEALL